MASARNFPKVSANASTFGWRSRAKSLQSSNWHQNIRCHFVCLNFIKTRQAASIHCVIDDTAFDQVSMQNEMSKPSRALSKPLPARRVRQNLSGYENSGSATFYRITKPLAPAIFLPSGMMKTRMPTSTKRDGIQDSTRRSALILCRDQPPAGLSMLSSGSIFCLCNSCRFVIRCFSRPRLPSDPRRHRIRRCPPCL